MILPFPSGRQYEKSALKASESRNKNKNKKKKKKLNLEDEYLKNSV